MITTMTILAHATPAVTRITAMVGMLGTAAHCANGTA